eukprot:286944-Chlamydomonas_euryale.AAC.2
MSPAAVTAAAVPQRSNYYHVRDPVAAFTLTFPPCIRSLLSLPPHPYPRVLLSPSCPPTSHPHLFASLPAPATGASTGTVGGRPGTPERAGVSPHVRPGAPSVARARPVARLPRPAQRCRGAAEHPRPRALYGQRGRNAQGRGAPRGVWI